MKDEVRSLIRYRFKRAKAAYADGKSLLRQGSYESAINRFYYAGFYAARALLALKGLDASRHSGVISLFHQHFVKNEGINKEIARALTRSYERRLDSDYEDFVTMSGDEAKQVKEEMNRFIKACEDFFNSQKPSSTSKL